MNSLFLRAWCLAVVMMATLATTEEVTPVGAPRDGTEVSSAVEAENTAARANVPPGFEAENEETNIGEDDKERSTDDEDESSAKKFFFAYGSTTTAYGVSRYTRTVPFTCFTAVNTAACTGRRKKSSNRFRFVSSTDSLNLDSGLQSSASSPLPSTLTDVEDGKNAKFFFTVWSTSTSLLTITSYSTDTRATVSVSAGCSIPNFVYNGC